MTREEMDRFYRGQANPAPVYLGDVPMSGPGMTEQQAIQNMGLQNQRPSQNVEIRHAPYGRSIDEQTHNNWVNEETMDYLAALYGGIVPGAQTNPAAYTTDPYEDLSNRPPHDWSQNRTYPDISAGMYPPKAGEAVMAGGYFDTSLSQLKRIPKELSANLAELAKTYGPTAARTGAGMVPGAGYVDASEDFGRGAQDVLAQRYGSAAANYTQGAINAGLETFLPMLPSLAVVGAPSKIARAADDLPPSATQLVAPSGNVIEPPKTIKAYHGSPHDFDRFDLSQIGTGEGAQAYGHGLYFAEKEGVAKSYRDALAKVPENDPVANAWDMVNKYGQKPEELLATLERVPNRSPMMEGTIEALRSGSYKDFKAPGHMYEVEIGADPEHFLDWDKPLDAHAPEIQDIMRSQGYSPPASNLNEKYRTLGYTAGPEFKNPDEVKRLADAGIPGVKYLDQGSRSAGEGSRNYVTFRDDIVKILRKYGVASMAALPPAVLYSLQQQYGVGPSSDEGETY